MFHYRIELDAWDPREKNIVHLHLSIIKKQVI